MVKYLNVWLFSWIGALYYTADKNSANHVLKGEDHSKSVFLSSPIKVSKLTWYNFFIGDDKKSTLCEVTSFKTHFFITLFLPFWLLSTGNYYRYSKIPLDLKACLYITKNDLIHANIAPLGSVPWKMMRFDCYQIWEKNFADHKWPLCTESLSFRH